MLLVPAIDLKNGLCVRLRQGNFDDVTVYSKDPISTAEYWYGQGARRLHLVDLDGALSGRPENQSFIKKILEVIKGRIPVQVGGGIRDLDTIENYLNMGVSNVIIGTAAIKNRNFLRLACIAFPGYIIVGLDSRNGKLAINGWNETTSFDILDVSKEIENYGCSAFIYTDISRDGMLSGIDFKYPLMLTKHVHIPVYVSGGIVNILDIQSLCSIENSSISGAILGRSLYEKTLDFRKAQEISDKHSKMEKKE